jgi:hypothetical protein
MNAGGCHSWNHTSGLVADRRIFSHFFLVFPQGSLIVHSFRTVRPRFFVAAQNEMRESAFTASVKVALPVIVQGWFCGD